MCQRCGAGEIVKQRTFIAGKNRQPFIIYVICKQVPISQRPARLSFVIHGKAHGLRKSAAARWPLAAHAGAGEMLPVFLGDLRLHSTIFNGFMGGVRSSVCGCFYSGKTAIRTKYSVSAQWKAFRSGSNRAGRLLGVKRSVSRQRHKHGGWMAAASEKATHQQPATGEHGGKTDRPCAG